MPSTRQKTSLVLIIFFFYFFDGALLMPAFAFLSSVPSFSSIPSSSFSSQTSNSSQFSQFPHSSSFDDYTREEPLFCKRYGLGRYFYCDEERDEGKEEIDEIDIRGKKPIAKLSQEEREVRAMKERDEIQQKLERLQVLSVMYPTSENLRRYLAFQKEQLDRASKYSAAWKKVLWNTPELDYRLRSPASSLGNQIAMDQKNQEKEQILKSLSVRYGIFFFYSSKCVYCQKYTLILKSFLARYGLEVMPITIDGVILKKWPTSQIDRGQSEKFYSFYSSHPSRFSRSSKNPSVFISENRPVPATFLFDQIKKEVIPVGYGLLTYDELSTRIFDLVKEREEIEETGEETEEMKVGTIRGTIKGIIGEVKEERNRRSKRNGREIW